jgi:hypothetical protein
MNTILVILISAFLNQKANVTFDFEGFFLKDSIQLYVDDKEIIKAIISTDLTINSALVKSVELLEGKHSLKVIVNNKEFYYPLTIDRQTVNYFTFNFNRQNQVLEMTNNKTIPLKD